MAEIKKPDLDSIAQGIFELGYAVGPVSEEMVTIATNTLEHTASYLITTGDNHERTAEVLGSMLVFFGYVIAHLAEQGIDAVVLADVYKTALEHHVG